MARPSIFEGALVDLVASGGKTDGASVARERLLRFCGALLPLTAPATEGPGGIGFMSLLSRFAGHSFLDFRQYPPGLRRLGSWWAVGLGSVGGASLLRGGTLLRGEGS